MTPLLLVQTTLPSEPAAAAMADAFVENRLAACVQASPVRSTYRWEGAVERADEVRLDIKTTPAALDALLARLRADHPYDEPEVLVFEARASGGYAAWAAAATGA